MCIYTRMLDDHYSHHCHIIKLLWYSGELYKDYLFIDKILKSGQLKSIYKHYTQIWNDELISAFEV